jgi:hypothetical protein
MAADRFDATPVRRARRRFVGVGVVVPLVVTAIGVLLMLVWQPQLPDPIAVHWDAAGDADGFGTVWTVILLTLVVGAGLTALFAIPVLVASREGEWGPTMRFLGALSAGVNLYLVALATWSVAMQRGLADAHDAPSIIPALIVGAVTGLVVGIGAWAVQPDVVSSGGGTPVTTEPGRIDLAAGERVVWMRTATMPTGGMIAVVGATIASAIAALWLALTGSGLWIPFGLLSLLFAVLVCTTSVFRVRVSDAGLVVRAAAGLPRFRVGLDDVEAVVVTHVEPMAQFGGWGIRLGVDGRFGVVVRRGDAIQVARTGKRPFVVTVDDAATGAALLKALAGRARANSALDRG